MTMIISPACIDVHNIRDQASDRLNEDIACRIVSTYAHELAPLKVVAEHDASVERSFLSITPAKELNDGGPDALNTGLRGIEEVDYRVVDATDRIISLFAKYAAVVDHADGINLEYKGWRMKLYSFNTEPLLCRDATSYSGNTTSYVNPVLEKLIWESA
jgi:hypothetical protein